MPTVAYRGCRRPTYVNVMSVKFEMEIQIFPLILRRIQVLDIDCLCPRFIDYVRYVAGKCLINNPVEKWKKFIKK